MFAIFTFLIYGIDTLDIIGFFSNYAVNLYLSHLGN